MSGTGESYEFLIEVVDRVADGYRLRVAFPDPDSPTGVGENRITAPFDPADPELLGRLALLPTSVLASAARTRLAISPMEQTAQEVGHRLFQALMVGETLGDLSRLRRRAAANGADVRVSLRLHPAELAALPWEYMYDARADRREFLGRVCMLTRSSGELSPVPALEVAGPLRVLAMVSLPADLAELDAEYERRRLAEALAPMVADGRMELTWIPATKAALQAALNRGQWHVFHYIGHGDFDEHAGEGRLAFTGGDGGAEFVSARQLAVSFGQHPTLRLVVLNACQSARASGDDRRSGVAAALVHAGVAAVVAMQFPITDGAAPTFSGEFYGTLAAGRPVDLCVRAGRTAITLENAASLEWGTPVLHLRSADGLLFRQREAVVVRETGSRPERAPEPAPPPTPTPTPTPTQTQTPTPTTASAAVAAVVAAKLAASSQPSRPFRATLSDNGDVTVPEEITALTLSADTPEPLLGVGTRGGALAVFDAAGRQTVMHNVEPGSAKPSVVHRVRFAPHGGTVVCLTSPTANQPEHMTVWDRATGLRRDHTRHARVFAYHPTDPGRFLAGVSGHDLSLRTFDRPADPIQYFHADNLSGEALADAAFSPDGRYVIATGGRRTVFWDAGGSWLGEVDAPPAQTGRSIMPLADRSRVVLPQPDGTLQAFQLADGGRAGRVDGPVFSNPGPVAWAVGPTGIVAAPDTTHQDGVAGYRLFHLDHYRTYPLPGTYSRRIAPVFSPDGRFVALVLPDLRTVRFFDLEGDFGR